VAIWSAGSCAPGAVSSQQTTLEVTVEPDGIAVSAARFELLPMAARRLDCGIAMLHLQVAACANGIRGEWKFLANPPEVAQIRGVALSISSFWNRRSLMVETVDFSQ